MAEKRVEIEFGGDGVTVYQEYGKAGKMALIGELPVSDLIVQMKKWGYVITRKSAEEMLVSAIFGIDPASPGVD